MEWKKSDLKKKNLKIYPYDTYVNAHVWIIK